MKQLFIIVLTAGLIACNQQAETEEAQGAWITGSKTEMIMTIENQFGGFDPAMVEIGYRYQELYWAGQDENWEYAGHQVEHIQIALENGLQRRPERAKSAEHFQNDVLPGMENAITGENVEEFTRNFNLLTTACNSCHTLEDVPFFNVMTPAQRHSVIRKQ
ncbi:MAG: hypothetical protein ACNA7V_08110 [Bacteroidales bacterium]